MHVITRTSDREKRVNQLTLVPTSSTLVTIIPRGEYVYLTEFAHPVGSILLSGIVALAIFSSITVHSSTLRRTFRLIVIVWSVIGSFVGSFRNFHGFINFALEALFSKMKVIHMALRAVPITTSLLVRTKDLTE